MTNVGRKERKLGCRHRKPEGNVMEKNQTSSIHVLKWGASGLGYPIHEMVKDISEVGINQIGTNCNFSWPHLPAQ